MANYGLRSESLIDTSDELVGVTGQIDSALDALDAAVNNYMASNLGETANEFRIAQMQWREGVTLMNANLAGGARALDDINAGFIDADNRGAAGLR